MPTTPAPGTPFTAPDYYAPSYFAPQYFAGMGWTIPWRFPASPAGWQSSGVLRGPDPLVSSGSRTSGPGAQR